MKAPQRSRFLFLHPDANAGKIAALEALQGVYTTYLQVCVAMMIAAHRFTIPLSQRERQAFFPKCNTLTSQIVKNCRAHAVQIVSAWAASKYTNTLKKKFWCLWQGGWIDDVSYVAFCAIGKHSIDTPTPLLSAENIELYWRMFLLNPDFAGKTPTISDRCGMRMSEMTATFAKSIDVKLTQWWIGFSHLQAGKRHIDLPLVATPYIQDVKDASKGVLARKDKQGRWRFEVCDTKKWEIPMPAPNKTLGCDVGFNTWGALSNGHLFGTDLKARFLALYEVIKRIRANRQRQGLRRNSKRLECLESRLTGLVKGMVGQITNTMLRLYPDYLFVFEDLNLSGCKGAMRFAYRALYHSAARKMPTAIVNPAYTSQECPSCGYVSKNNRNGIKFRCRSCGRKSHADVVGGINLLRRSEDKQIGLDDDPPTVKRILQERYLLRRNAANKDSSARTCKNAPVPSGPDLTVDVPISGVRIELNQGRSGQLVLFG